MKRGSSLRTVKFIFISVVLFVLTFTAVVITILNVYSPKFLAKINGKEVAYFSSPAEFDEAYEKLKAEKQVKGIESVVYLTAKPEFELRYVRKSMAKSQNQYTNLREFIKTEYTTYAVYVKDNKEMIFATEKEANTYMTKIKAAVKTSVKSTVLVKKEINEELKTITDAEVAKTTYNSIASRHKPITRQSTVSSSGVYYSGGKIYAQKATGELNTFISAGRRPSTGVVTNHYGPNRGYSTGWHPAIDIASLGRENVNIYSYKAGTVVKVIHSNSGYGNHVVVYHGTDPLGNAFYTLYAHFYKIYVSVGQSVTQSTVLGLMGTTGNSSGVHLHFEMYTVLNNKQTMYNPAYYI